ncbi:MAG: sodium:calcium antiporter, partial [Ruminiclostridium sp.]|nr:sodium:calcium antiporter [Ruminiclostridium sp.]
PSPIGFEKIFLIDGLVALYSVVILWLLVMKDKKLAKAGGIVMILSYALYFVYLVLQPMILGTV